MISTADDKVEFELHREWQSLVRECQAIVSPINNNNNGSKSIKFSQKYNDLIHSGEYTANLIKLEFSYWPALEDLFITRDGSIEELEQRSGDEIERAIEELGKTQTEEGISLLSSRHCQDMERLLNNWNMSIEALKDTQREDFIDEVNKLWDEYVKQKHSELDFSSSVTPIPSFGIVESAYQIKMEESFTVNLGSQLKTAHNLRIMAVDTLYLCDTKRIRSPQIRTQTAMSLYSHNLSGIVMLVDNHFNTYYGIQHEFAKMCNNSNEFHFDSFNKQIQHIRDNVMPHHAGRKNLETGDCYITRHSNLSNAHVVFHLVTDDSLKHQDINSRHPILASLRNILRVAHANDIKTISIPLLLVDEMNEEILTVNWCLKRAELVLKRVKGFLIEMASMSTGVDQGTIQFLVPKGISEELFASLSDLIPDVFRLSNSLNLKSTNSQTNNSNNQIF